ncbi:signal recognition particle-docking protein FtsY [uncultured Pluralibacter sp.]|uniref:signal recognition particle-docking protein FtsY n=1 Tax=uncultured Pluralibacter sp. TaxID=1490864 RepID=UPI002630E171|nr:signal recognition particle-docking protein FtsY [uncultured Pluralibacter sp.]
MAKNKKKGFFSWLGFGNKEQEPQQEAEQQQTEIEQTSAEPAVDEVVEQRAAEPEAQSPAHSEEESRVFAEDVVEVTQEVVAQESAAPAAESQPEDAPAVAIVPQPEAIPEPAPVVEPPVATPEPVAAEPVVEQAPVVEDAPVVIAQPAPVAKEETPVEIVEDDATAEEPPLSDEELEALALASAEEAPQDEDEIIDVVQPQQEQEKPTKEGFFARLKRSLLKTKENLGSGFISLFRGKKIDDDLFEELEEQLLIADVGVDTTRKIIASLTEGASRKQLRDAEALYGLLKDEMGQILAKVDEPLNIEGKTPFVILMVGVNGVGKTTTIGKLARQFEQQGKSVMLAAGDTFRAAAVEQLQVWGQRNNIPVIAQHTGADSASVIFDAIQAAKARNVDVLIADTAGRLQNKSHLMEELKKIVRVMKKLDEDAPHEVMLTIDASTGQNAISQAKLFHEAVGLTGITLTKLDGTAKGGVIFSVADQFGIPIRYIGVGERIEDLRPFKSDDFIEALFARED